MSQYMTVVIKYPDDTPVGDFMDKVLFKDVPLLHGKVVSVSNGQKGTQGIWIRVEEQMPSKNQEVLGILEGCEVGRRIQRTITYVGASDHDFESDGFEISNCWDVTHWMPLPDPPKTQIGPDDV